MAKQLSCHGEGRDALPNHTEILMKVANEIDSIIFE